MGKTKIIGILLWNNLAHAGGIIPFKNLASAGTSRFNLNHLGVKIDSIKDGAYSR